MSIDKKAVADLIKAAKEIEAHKSDWLRDHYVVLDESNEPVGRGFPDEDGKIQLDNGNYVVIKEKENES